MTQFCNDLDVSRSGKYIYMSERFRHPKASSGHYDILWDNLPPLPEGLDRDSEGRIWVGLIKERSSLITWLNETSGLNLLFCEFSRAGCQRSVVEPDLWCVIKRR